MCHLTKIKTMVLKCILKQFMPLLQMLFFVHTPPPLIMPDYDYN